MKKLGRNDLCSCGSGRKYKKCCISSKADSAPALASPYRIDQLVDARNRDLHEEVKRSLSIHLFGERDGWSAKTVGKNATIGCSTSAYPIACFTHELLHLKLELDGLIEPYIQTDDPDDPMNVSFLFNQFSHHKMFSAFCDLGFAPNEFLADSEQEVADTIDSQVLQLEGIFETSGQVPLDDILVATLYLSLCSPHIADGAEKHWRDRLRCVSSDSFTGGIDRILTRWKKDDTLDCRMPFASLFKLCNKPNVAFSNTSTGQDPVMARDAIEAKYQGRAEPSRAVFSVLGGALN